jgi:hypothetical protein
MPVEMKYMAQFFTAAKGWSENLKIYVFRLKPFWIASVSQPCLSETG